MALIPAQEKAFEGYYLGLQLANGLGLQHAVSGGGGLQRRERGRETETERDLQTNTFLFHLSHQLLFTVMSERYMEIGNHIMMGRNSIHLKGEPVCKSDVVTLYRKSL